VSVKAGELQYMLIALRTTGLVSASTLEANNKDSGVLLTGITCDLRNFKVLPQPPDYAATRPTTSADNRGLHRGLNVLRLRVGPRFRHGQHRLVLRLRSGSRYTTYRHKVSVGRRR
jgi:hypothetical protein